METGKARGTGRISIINRARRRKQKGRNRRRNKRRRIDKRNRM